MCKCKSSSVIFSCNPVELDADGLEAKSSPEQFYSVEQLFLGQALNAQ